MEVQNGMLFTVDWHKEIVYEVVGPRRARLIENSGPLGYLIKDMKGEIISDKVYTSEQISEIIQRGDWLPLNILTEEQDTDVFHKGTTFWVYNGRSSDPKCFYTISKVFKMLDGETYLIYKNSGKSTMISMNNAKRFFSSKQWIII